MIKKIKYKIWKHLTKSLVPDGIIKRAVLNSTYARMRAPKHSESNINQAPINKVSVPTEETKGIASESVTQNENRELPKIVALQGIYYSGSSTLVGMLQEFDNIRVVGYSDSFWSKTAKKTGQTSECCFFSASGFTEMIQVFKHKSPEVIDQRIRIFIQNFNNVIANGGFRPFEKLPDLYNEGFKEITQELLLTIIDMDEHTRNYMRSRQFPHAAWETENSSYDTCCFMKGKGKRRYLSYSFADLSEEKFHQIIADYLVKFFSILSGKEYVVYDQLLSRRSLELINQYLSTPIKQIVVIRDPRDQFLSANRRGTDHLSREPKGFKEHNLRRLSEFPAEYPHRMILRFEDIVLNYEATKKKVMDFLGLKPENHVAPKSVFDPAISVANIGAWRNYHRREFMDGIEKELSEYCFYPEKENLSDEAIQLLISSGNWSDDIIC